MTQKPVYTLEDHEQAKANLRRWSDAWDNYSGNNPNKYQAEIRAARRQLRLIETCLKEHGVLEISEREKLDRELDKAFPNAKSKEIVEFQGKRYQRRFFALDLSRSRKTVNEWGKSWEEVK